jgi:hypothetical protein
MRKILAAAILLAPIAGLCIVWPRFLVGLAIVIAVCFVASALGWAMEELSK